jgi:hypothetical protein
MRSNLFWLSDEQWGSIQPLLPMDVRGKARVDDRRVISGTSAGSQLATTGWQETISLPFAS